MIRKRRTRAERLRRRVHYFLDAGGSDRVSKLVHRGLIALVLSSVLAVVLESVPAFADRFGNHFFAFELFAAGVFTIEYLSRLWSAPDHTPYAHMSVAAASWAFARTPLAIVDLVCVLPVYLALFLPADLRVLLLLRLLRFFKLARYSPGMRSLMAALEAEKSALAATSVVLLGLVLVSASAMHLVEHDAQPEKFGSIPDAMWWAIVTLTTVGYGDVVPVTLAGRIVAGFTMLAGLMMIALPIGIVSKAFADEIHRREFVVTWGMLARVPLFSTLSAVEIAEVMDYLHAQTAAPGTMIVRRGEAASNMYFIASGRVEVETQHGPIQLGEGQFFGETGLLNHARRNANVRALESTKLLMLDGRDLKALMERNEDIAKHIEEVAAARRDAGAADNQPPKPGA